MGTDAPFYRQPGILDMAGLSPIAAFSCARLRAAYNGPLITVRRASDNITIGVGAHPSTGRLNRELLKALCPGQSGFVTKWWDQTGNGRHLTQATNASQPRIVLSGVVDTMATNVPVMVFDGSDDRLTRADALGLTGSPNVTIVASAKLGQTGQKMPWAVGDPSASQNLFGFYCDTTHVYQDYGGCVVWITQDPTLAPHAYVQRHTAGNGVDTIDLRWDGVQRTKAGNNTTGALNLTNTKTVIGGPLNEAAGFFRDMSLSTWIAFDSVVSGTALTTLEAALIAQTL